MNELINLVVQKTGLSQENAQKAVQTVVDFIKAKLPAPIASQVDAVLSGDVSGLGAQGGEMLKGKLGGMFGGEKTS